MSRKKRFASWFAAVAVALAVTMGGSHPSNGSGVRYQAGIGTSPGTHRGESS